MTKLDCTSFLVLFILVSTSLFGQRTKSEYIRIPYTQLPEMVLDEEMQTYSVIVQGIDGSNFGHRDIEEVIEYFKMDGFKRLENGGHLRIVYSQDQPLYLSKTAHKEKHTRKDKNDREYTYYTYNYTFSFQVLGSVRVVDYNGTELYSKKYNKSNSVSGREYKSANERSKYLESDRNSALKEFARTSYGSFQKSARSQVRKKFDYDHEEMGEKFYWIKKSEDEEKSEAVTKELNDILKALKPTELPKDVKSKLIEFSDYYEELGNKYYDLGLTKKKYMRIAWDMLRNSQLIHYIVGNYDQSLELANRLLEMDVQDKFSKMIVKKVEGTIVDCEKHGVENLYFERDLENAIPPEKVKELEMKMEETLSENNVLDGYLVDLNQDTLYGKFYVKKESNQLIFGKNSNVLFKTEESNDAEEINIELDSINNMFIGEQNFSRASMKSYASGVEKSSNYLLREIYTSEKISLFEIQLQDVLVNNNVKEYAVQKGEEECLSLLSTQFLLLNKGLAKYFSDCEDLKTMCENGDFKLSELDLMKAVRIYDQLCE